VLLFVGFGLLLLTACGAVPRHQDIQVGQPIPPFELTSLDGTTVNSESLKGKPVVLNFWATWCGPCVREIPTLKELHRADAVRVVSIALDDEGEAVVRPFVAKQSIDYPVLLGGQEIFQRFNGYAIPYTLVLDSSLNIVEMHRGLVTSRRLEKDVRRAMEN
jgi:thiol-disulfide isomerase/thioredoxin